MTQKDNQKIKNTKLRKIREESGLSQEEMGSLLGRSRGSYQHLERKGNLSSDDLVKLSRFFARPIEDFIDNPEIQELKEEPIAEEPPKRVLTQDEINLLNSYSQLSPESRLLLFGYIDGLKTADRNNYYNCLFPFLNKNI